MIQRVGVVLFFLFYCAVLIAATFIGFVLWRIELVNPWKIARDRNTFRE